MNAKIVQEELQNDTCVSEIETKQKQEITSKTKKNHFTSKELLELEWLELDNLANVSQKLAQNVGVTHLYPIPPLHLRTTSTKSFGPSFARFFFPPVISSPFSISSPDCAEWWATSSSSPSASESVAGSISLLDIKQRPCRATIRRFTPGSARGKVYKIFQTCVSPPRPELCRILTGWQHETASRP